MFKKIGPGALIAAAFIGPGTITACTLAGVGFGYALLWAVLLSVLATMFLQEMAARLGIITQKGLADALNDQLPSKTIKYLVIGIVLGAILVGNAAYEAGNIGGASLGLEAIFGEDHVLYYPYVVGGLSFILLWWGTYKLLERVFMVLITLMSISFLLTAFLTAPNLIPLLKGVFLPTMPDEGLLTVMALIGTTIVPYNLFLHASLVNEKWKSKNDLKAARTDTVVSIALGGLVSMAIVVAAAAIPSEEVSNAMHLTMALEPLYGEVARYFMGIGLFAAGITSSITAPLAAAYVANSCFGWKAKLHHWRFRLVWVIILALGVFFLSFGIKPIEVIKFAQIANGILLPAIAFLLVWMVNKRQLMGKHTNTRAQNLVAIVIVALTVLLGVKSIVKVLEII